MGGDEEAVRDRGSTAKQSISPQYEAPFCKKLLFENEGYCASRRLSGAQQYRNYPEIRDDQHYGDVFKGVGTGTAGNGII